MKLFKYNLTSVSFLLALSLPMLGQQSSHREGIPGYLDPSTGTFHIRPALAGPDAAATLTAFTGTLEFVFSIKVVSKVATGQAILCTATADLVDISSQTESENVITEEASTTAKLTGTTASCTVVIPYSWSLASGPTDTVGLSYSVSIVPTTATTQLFALTQRLSSQQLPSIPVPRTGTTTTKTIDPTI